MTHRTVMIAAAGSAFLLAGAFAFQLMGYAPCKMCIWQRWPHAAAAIIGLAYLFIETRVLLWLGALAAAITAGVGYFHAGVEQGWWEGPSSCTSGSITDLSPDELFEQIMNAPLVRCDEIAWSLGGISMAGWNGLLSTLLVFLWVKAATQK